MKLEKYLRVNYIYLTDNEKLTKELKEFSDTIEQSLINSGILYDNKKGCSRIFDVLIALKSQNIKKVKCYVKL